MCIYYLKKKRIYKHLYSIKSLCNNVYRIFYITELNKFETNFNYTAFQRFLRIEKKRKKKSNVFLISKNLFEIYDIIIFNNNILRFHHILNQAEVIVIYVLHFTINWYIIYHVSMINIIVIRFRKIEKKFFFHFYNFLK